MKPILRNFFLWMMILLPAGALHAQLQLTSADLAAIESTTLLSADEMPVMAAYYSAANPSYPPAPMNVLGIQGWSIGDGFYLLDDLSGDGSGGGSYAMDDSDPIPPAVVAEPLTK
jgi:hypothetical protein